MDYSLVCMSCKLKTGEAGSVGRCARCGGVLEIVYDYSTLRLPKDFRKMPIRQRKYGPFFPAKLSSLNEGGTRLLKAKSLDVEGVNIYLKREDENPTRSFKDRGSAVEIGKAVELGFGSVCCGSTGNMGLSVATYAKHEGLHSTIFVSTGANREKVGKIKKAGADVVEIDGDFNDAVAASERFAADERAFLCGDFHYRKEGQKGVIFELIEQFRYNLPDYLFIPVGNATLLAAVYKGLMEFRQLGWINGFPRIIAVQSEGCDPLVRAFREGQEVRYVRPQTYADAIAVGYPTFGFEGIAAIRETGGDAVGVSDDEIEAARRRLQNRESLSAEPGGAAGFAGFIKMYQENRRRFEGKNVVLVVTGNNEHPGKR